MRLSKLFPKFVGFALFAVTTAAPAARVGQVEKKFIVQPSAKLLALGQSAVARNPSPQLLIRIQYVSQITTAGLDALAVTSKDNNRQLTPNISLAEIRARAVDGVNKSAYFALRLYRTLQTSGAFPAGSIALDPVTIDGPEFRSQTVSSKHADDGVPAVLTIRFAMVRNTAVDVTSLTGDRYTTALLNTFANWVSPRFSVVTEPMAWPGSGGMIAAIGVRAAPNFSCPDETCLARSPEVGDFVSDRIVYPVDPKRIPVSLKSVGVSLPYPNEVADQDAVFLCPDTPSDVGSACPHEQVILAYARQALQQVDPYLATRFQWKRYLARFDERLAERWPGGVLDAGSRKRLTLIKKIMLTERTYLTQQSDAIVQAALDGVPGKTLRGQRQAERDYSNAVRSASSGFSLASLLSMATTISQFGEAYAAKDTSAQFTAIQAEMARAEKDQKIGEAASSKVAALFNANVLQMLESAPAQQTVFGTTVSERTLIDLQRKLRQIYSAQRLPPLPAVAECSRGVENGMYTVYYGDCRKFKLGKGDELEGNGYGHLKSDAVNMVHEFWGPVQVINGNWNVLNGKVIDLNLYQSLDLLVANTPALSSSTACYTIWDTGRPVDKIYMNRCVGKPDIFGDGTQMSKTDSAAFDAQLAEWRSHTSALIASE